ncbi:MAG: HD domain-containing protein [Oscillospiraceae bacterium]|jgi:3'-5' exoribonuclease|nr:HD domain-containing protein [Oscillospiraceae bacterium]
MERNQYSPSDGDHKLLRPQAQDKAPEKIYPPIAEVVKDSRWEGVLLVRSAEQRVASNGSKYLDMTLCDRSGDINAKVWDGNTPPPEIGRAVRVRGQVLEYNGRLQFRVERMRAVAADEKIPAETLVPCAPEDPALMLSEVRGAANAIASEGLRKLTNALLDQAGDALLHYPAAQKLHHAERSGLLHHTVGMLRLAKAFASLYDALDGDLLAAGVIAHDLAKITELQSDEFGMVREYTTEGLLIGHLVRGVVNIEQAGKDAGVDPYTVLLMQHMILAHHGEAEYGSPRKPMFPEAEVLHIIDQADAHIFEMTAAIQKLRPGAFSEKIWSLERRLYKIDRKDNLPSDEQGGPLDAH